MIICQLSIKINWTNNQQNQQNLPNNLLVHREIITLAKGWWRLSTTNDRSWNQELLSQIKNSPSEHMHWWSFTKYTMLVDNRRKNKRDNAPERWGYHTFSSLLGAWSWITTHCSHLLITTSLLVKDGHRSRIDPTTMQRETNWPRQERHFWCLWTGRESGWDAVGMPAAGICHLMVCRRPLVMSPWMSENPATCLPSVIL